MQTSVRKVGNSAGMTLPANLVKSQNLCIGDKLKIEEHQGFIIIKKVNEKPKYSLDALLAQCNANAPDVETLDSWNNTQTTGAEIW